MALSLQKEALDIVHGYNMAYLVEEDIRQKLRDIESTFHPWYVEAVTLAASVGTKPCKGRYPDVTMIR